MIHLFRYCPVCGSERFEINDPKSKHCLDCGFRFYLNAAAACAAFIENERGELLMARRAKDPAKGTLDLIGGFVDPGESIEQAILREIEEETGLALPPTTPLRMLFSLPNTYHYSGLVVHTADAFFHIRISSATPLQPHDDIAECFWVRPEDIRPADIGFDSIRNGLARFLQQRNA